MGASHRTVHANGPFKLSRLAKMGGTALASAAFLFFSENYEESVLLPFLSGSIFVFDLIYVVMILYVVRRGNL